ncbi:elongation factor G [Thermobispora bispora]|uniref:Elongation factor G-like protein n=1 Tax=Thermobispora bispora (strain ATCC 19993 / DSM 43833 / CBS 139.67 / JCM 10125 / KCTC 9307 / NBRC 14880 / R51) TaxID=469371 RepID=D6Y2D8_THEBD|nr:elongation factor G-like protein EF-G2 [Thermobispora bispora]ADG88787.1 small GTP-binding protein [Thermobispora bispora DSM 43833]MBO2473371.1 elongation factor G-like protein EF-G2 [Actinomycetales bacterium]MBX6167586.1 elongation factor G-like protein EF-G2 [Thermobispora bispora]QSI48555.1 elongation factor G-like protein EF-G2 [Thermobispora bispora]
MAERSTGATQGAAGRAPTADRPDMVRNVVLVGHSGSGKTTLVEALLAETGVIQRPGRVEDGTTVSDYDEVEVRQKRSVNLAVAPTVFNGIKINLLDTPGYADFIGDLRAGLRAADAALFVISAADGVDGLTKMLWEECALVGMPRAVVISKIDHQRADFDGTLAQCRDGFGEGIAPVYLPVDGTGLLSLVSRRFIDYSGGTRTERDPDPGQLDLIERYRGDLIEQIIQESEDESLMDRYLAGEEIDDESLITDLEKAVARGSFYPVLAAAPGVGMQEILELITKGFPSPLEHPLPEITTIDGRPVEGLTADPEGPLVAEVVKTTSDPYVGRISLVRVFSGTLRPDMTVHVSGHGLADRGHEDHDVDERIGTLSSPLGKTQRTIGKCVAGDICAIAKLSRAETGDTLSAKDRPLLMAPWQMPEPLLPVAIEPRSKADEDKLGQALSRLVAEDPTLRLEHNAETHQLVLWCMGEAHSDVLLDRLSRRYGVQVDRTEVRVPLRETFAGKAQGMGRNVKQTGGHGQYAICHIEVEPLPAGSGFEFIDKIVGGVIPRQFIPSVEKGIRAQMERGVLAGYPMVDIQVTLYDGKSHPVDSSDMAFQIAGQLALKDAASKTQVILLEPVDEVSVLIPDEYVGAIMSDLSARRGRVLGTEPVGTGRTVVRAEVPQLEITRYAVDLRSLSQGTGTFTRSFLRYEPLPAHLAAKVTQAA